MINLIQLPRFITFIAVLYAILVFLIYLFYSIYFSAQPSAFQVLKYILSCGGILTTILMVILNMKLSWVWSKCKFLNEWLFPDLNGSWSMIIKFQQDGVEKTKYATASIKQSFIKMSMEVESEDSTSVTLAISLKKDPESQRPMFYYIFRVEPNQPDSHTYNGTAGLRYIADRSGILKGSYYTSQFRGGFFELTRKYYK